MHGPGADEPLVWHEGAGTAAKGWLYAEHLGSIVAVANKKGLQRLFHKRSKLLIL